MYLVIKRKTDCLLSDIDEATFAVNTLEDIKEIIVDAESNTSELVKYSVFKLHSTVLVEPVKYTHFACV